MPPLIYLEEYGEEEDNSREPLSNLTSNNITSEPGPPIEIYTKELTLDMDYDALSETSAPMREGSMGHLSPGDIARCQNGPDPPIFST